MDHFPHYIIQSGPYPEAAAGILNDQRARNRSFPGGRKSCDPFSNLKSNNYLLYVLAALYAREHRLKIAWSSIARNESPTARSPISSMPGRGDLYASPFGRLRGGSNETLSAGSPAQGRVQT